MLVTAMDINMTIINNNAGNGDGYKRDNKHFKYINIYYPKLYIYIIITKKKKCW